MEKLLQRSFIEELKLDGGPKCQCHITSYQLPLGYVFSMLTGNPKLNILAWESRGKPFKIQILIRKKIKHP